MTAEATPITSAYSPQRDRFTLENDDLPPFMSESGHAVADFGVSSTSRPHHTSQPIHSGQPGVGIDEPEIFVPEEETLSYTAYCPEDAASAFFSDGEVRTLVPVPPVTSAPSTSFFKDEPDENELETNHNQDHALVVATPIHSNTDDGGGGRHCTNRGMHFLKLLILLFGLILVCVILYISNVGDVAEKISGGGGGGPIQEPLKSVETEGHAENDAQDTSTASVNNPVSSSAQPTSAPSVFQGLFQSSSPSTQKPHPTLSPQQPISTQQPSSQPSSGPTFAPFLSPFSNPTAQPSETQFSATSAPYFPSTNPPTASPSESPSSAAPSSSPSTRPSAKPSPSPSWRPSANPSSLPSRRPSATPSSFPSLKPSGTPTASPSLRPSSTPSSVSTVAPTSVWSEIESPLFEGDFANDEYGTSVSMSSNGQHLAVGSASGIVRTYKYQSGSWNVHGMDIIGSGSNAVLSGDGSTLLTGNPFAAGGRGQITTFIFNLTTSQWQNIGQVLQGEQLQSALGSVMALSYDGQIMVLGEPGYSDSAGRVRLYEFDPLHEWGLSNFGVQNPSAGDQVGSSVAVSSDGYTVFVGAVGEDRNGGRLDAGAVFVYRYDPQLRTTVQVGNTKRGSDAGQGFGKQIVSVSDGSSYAQLSQSGNVAAFKLHDASGQWRPIFNRDAPVGVQNRTVLSIGLGADSITQQTTLVMSYSECKEQFPCVSSEEIGKVRVLVSTDGGGLKKWERLGRDLLNHPIQGFGLPVALSAYGESIAVGVPGSSSNEQFAGSVKLYERNA